MRRERWPTDTLLPVLQHLRYFREHVVNRIVIARANTQTDRLSMLPGPLKPAQDDAGQHSSLARPRRTPEEDQAFGEGARERRFCRKVRFLGQNPKIWYQEFNELQTPKLSKKQLCDRTPINAQRVGPILPSSHS